MYTPYAKYARASFCLHLRILELLAVLFKTLTAKNGKDGLISSVKPFYVEPTAKPYIINSRQMFSKKRFA